MTETTASTAASAATYYAQRFSRALPGELAQETGAMSWQDFLDTYCPPRQPIRLRHWASRTIGRGLHEYEARFQRSDVAPSSMLGNWPAQTTASGEIRALSEMLHQLGYPLEIERFYQHEHDGTHSTIIRGVDRREQSCWALGFGSTGPHSATQAMLAAVARLY